MQESTGATVQPNLVQQSDDTCTVNLHTYIVQLRAAVLLHAVISTFPLEVGGVKRGSNTMGC